jgi:predicted dehydrogenase
MKSKEKNSRRDFIKKSAATAAALMIVPRHVLGGRGFIPPSDIVNIGIVGAGGQSMFSITELLKLDDVRLISVADPSTLWSNDILYSSDTGRGPAKKFIEAFYSGKKQNNKISEYEDFRVMLEKERSLDAIVCATPDNTHAYVSVKAMRAGKHVYCEKPLTHNIWEARKVREVARETGLATQMGNQGTSDDQLRTTVEYLRSGVIGTVREAHSWVSTSRWLPGLDGYPKESTPVPAGFNWDLWLGPTLWQPYNKVYTPVKWRDFWTFGCGALGDFGCHDLNTVTWAFNLRNPDSIEVIPSGNKGSNIIAPYGEIGYYKFKENSDQPSFNLTWYSGGLRPALPDLFPRDVKLAGRGAMYVGDKGILLTNGGTGTDPRIFPESLQKSFTPPAPFIPRSKGHHREWIDAIKGGPAAFSNFEYGGRLTEIVLLGVLSLRLGGEKVYWDAAKMKAVGIPDADAIIREPVRKGWEIE